MTGGQNTTDRPREWTKRDKALLRKLLNEGLNDRAIAKRLDRGMWAVASYRQRHNLKRQENFGQEQRPAPVDFASIGPTMTVNQLRLRYKVADKTVRRWLAEAGIERKKPQLGRRPAPEGFADIAGDMLNVVLAEHYGVSQDMVIRWRRETGCPSRVLTNRSKAARCRRSRPIGRNTWAPAPVTVPDSLADRAAHHLRRYFPMVCRAKTLNPKADPNLWIVGRNQMSSGDMIDLAEDKGFIARWAA